MTKLGGWTINDNLKPCPLPEEVASAFSEVNAHLLGAVFVPVLYCGSQLVSGMNYMIICKQTLVTHPPLEHLVTMVIYKPLNGPAVITSIDQIL
jgi:hypothetical protein